MIEIRAMQKDDIDAVVELMARAFQQAALYRYLEHDEQKRAALLREVFSLRVPFGFDERDGEVALEGGAIIAAALWSRPDTPMRENLALQEAIARRGAAVSAKWEAFHHALFDSLGKACAAPHWSLAPIAVLPEAWGKGVAGALIRRKLALIDAQGAPCLLGTQDETNTRIYTHYGFKTVSQTVIAEAAAGFPALVSWAMLRDAGGG